MKKLFVRKTAIILGICIISLSLIMFLAHEISYIFSIVEYFKNSVGISSGFNYIGGFLSPLSYLISGFGFGGVIILLALMFDPSKTISLTQEFKTVELKTQNEENIL